MAPDLQEELELWRIAEAQMLTMHDMETTASLDDVARAGAVLDYKYAVQRAIGRLPPKKGGAA